MAKMQRKYRIIIEYSENGTGTRKMSFKINGKSGRLPKEVEQWIARDFFDETLRELLYN